jgi:hypothetical protein
MWQMHKYAAVAFAFGIAFSAIAQAPLAIYTDNLVNGFQDWGWGGGPQLQQHGTHPFGK